VAKAKKRTWRHELAEMVAKESNRYALQYVYHDGDAYVASDGRRLGLVRPAEKPATPAVFLDAKAFPVADAVVTVTDKVYPPYTSVIPNTAKADCVVTWAASDVETALQLSTALAECQKHDNDTVTSVVYYATAKGITHRGAFVGVTPLDIRKCVKNEWAWRLDAAFLRDALRLAVSRQADTVSVEFHGEGESPVVFRWGNGELVLIMPMDMP